MLFLVMVVVGEMYSFSIDFEQVVVVVVVVVGDDDDDGRGWGDVQLQCRLRAG